MLKILFTFLTKQATLMRRPSVLSLPPQLVFPAFPEPPLNGRAAVGRVLEYKLRNEKIPGSNPSPDNGEK
jgi:hypothetical protein